MAYKHPMAKYGRSKSRFGCLFVFLLIGLVVGVGVFVWSRRPSPETDKLQEALEALEREAANLNDVSTEPPAPATIVATITPPPTPDISAELAAERKIFFPNAGTVGRIVTVPRIPGGWDVTYLQDLVGHLEGTSWLGETGNTVLAGHFEDEVGDPGPFRYLYHAEVGDRIMVQDGGESQFLVYQVTEVFTTSPTDLEVLRNTLSPRLTLITCDAWNPDRDTYEERLVVIAEPIQVVASSDRSN